MENEFWSFPKGIVTLQVNLFQKLLFFHQLTHNMMTNCSSNCKFNAWNFQAQIWRNQVVYCQIASDIQNNFCTQHVLPMFCKKKSFWQRFTCTTPKLPKNCPKNHPDKICHKIYKLHHSYELIDPANFEKLPVAWGLVIQVVHAFSHCSHFSPHFWQEFLVNRIS